MQLLRIDDEVSSMAPFLEEEVARLERSVRLVRAVAGEQEEEPEPIHLPELLPRLVDLFDKHRHLEMLEVTLRCEDGLAPTRGQWTLVGRTILCQLSIAGRASLRRDRRVEIVVRREGEGMAVVARVEGEDRDAGTLPPVAARAEGMPGLAELIGASWRVEAVDDAELFVLDFPAIQGA